MHKNKFRDVPLSAVLQERLRKGRNSFIMNFRDKGPLENLPDTHGNICFDLSDPWGVGDGKIKKIIHHKAFYFLSRV